LTAPIPNPAHPFVESAHFRKWAWADEQGWDRNIVLPIQGDVAVDGTNPSGGWLKSPSNPILDLGASGKFDDTHVMFPCALRVGTTYRVYYGGHDGTAYTGIGLATTTDPYGVLTRYSTDPILPRGGAGDPDEVWVASPSVIYDPVANQYVMWYMGRDAAGTLYLCRATSSDGLTWTKDTPPNVFTLPVNHRWPVVMKLGKFYFCVTAYRYMAGDPARGLYLHSSIDGVNWVTYGRILTLGGAGEFDEELCNYAGIFWNLGVWYLLYMGWDVAKMGRVGMATSSTGWSWTKWPKNPVFSIGAAGEWDDSRVACPSLLMVERIFYLWYMGRDGAPNWRLGVAKLEC